MNNRKRETENPEISLIIETYDETGTGLLGFTVKKSSSGFENIMRVFNANNRAEIYTELNQLRDRLLKLRN